MSVKWFVRFYWRTGNVDETEPMSYRLASRDWQKMKTHAAVKSASLMKQTTKVTKLRKFVKPEASR